MATNKETEIEEILNCIQYKMGNSCDFNYLNPSTVTVESWENNFPRQLNKTDCYFLSCAFLKLASLLEETPNEHKS